MSRNATSKSLRMVVIRPSGFPVSSNFSGEEAIMRKEGDRLIIEPAPPKSLLAVLATLAPLHEDFPPIPDLPADPVDL